MFNLRSYYIIKGSGVRFYLLLNNLDAEKSLSYQEHFPERKILLLAKLLHCEDSKIDETIHSSTNFMPKLDLQRP